MFLNFFQNIMDLIKDGWFYEFSSDYPGQIFGIKVKKVLFEGKSDFQDILIFERFVFSVNFFA